MRKAKSVLIGLCASIVFLCSFAVHAQLPDFTELVERASPAVVNISTRKKIEQERVYGGRDTFMFPELEGLPPIFRDFFEHSFPAPRSPGKSPRRQQQAQSLGSGFI